MGIENGRLIQLQVIDIAVLPQDHESVLSAPEYVRRVVLYSGDYVVVPRKTGFSRETFSFVISIVGTVAALTAAVISLQGN